MRKANVMVLVGALLVAPLMALAASSSSSAPQNLEKKVRHALLMLPYYNVFDTLSFQVEGSNVILTGEVTWPPVKADAASAVRNIPGVTSVANDIQVLPVSPFDNQIRRAEYRAIFGQGGLYRYAMGALPSIHIIVKNGHVTLVGYVDSKMDKDLAGIYANQVPNVFSVTNDLKIVKS